ncbi:substrate-binding domain-containing protein [Methylocystis sp. JR02]|uniref:substrate-binding domain-containing protein n=1 Tax=Methylocystis sp. JR02 TaxID=3046284 RepID=UPI0024BB2770|nr:substrate-binding domain-containing protein [Methylocystis sp. JR02]MDJ0450744.1 substrate-binding domain-containing protein [Methylocystis sp. JR02]
MALSSPPSSARAEDSLRVCADPNNLPFSDANGAGFENKLAELVANELGKTLSYTWWAQRRGFIRNTLKVGACDLVMGVPTNYDAVETTLRYYRSAYVFVSRADRELDVTSLADDRLRTLKIGVHLVGDDGMNTPPAHVLGARGMVSNVVGYSIFGDYREPSPALRPIQAVESGTLDVAAVWGPFAGYEAKHASAPLHIDMIARTDDYAPLQFAFDISMGVRKGDDKLKRRLDDIIRRKGGVIHALLESYGVPLVDGD